MKPAQERLDVTMAIAEPWSTVGPPTSEQVAFYEKEGYLKYGRIFTEPEMDALRAHVDDMIAALPEGKRPEEMDVPLGGRPSGQQ